MSAGFGTHLSTDYLSEAMKPLMEQYSKGRGQVVEETKNAGNADSVDAAAAAANVQV